MFSVPVTETLGTINQVKSAIRQLSDIQFPLGRWRPSAGQQAPPREMVLQAALWKHPSYQDVRDRLKLPIPTAEVKVAGQFISINTRSKFADTGGLTAEAPVCHMWMCR